MIRPRGGRAPWGVLLSCVVLLACGRPAEQGDVDLARMIEQPRYDVFEASAFFADSAALRRPPEGTLPWDPTAPMPAVPSAPAPPDTISVAADSAHGGGHGDPGRCGR